MSKDQLQGQWNSLKGQVKQQWGKLTDDDLTQIQGKRDQLLGKLQQRYGLTKEKAEEELNRWEKAQIQGGQRNTQANQPNQQNQNQNQQNRNQNQNQNQNQQNRNQNQNQQNQNPNQNQKDKEKARF